MNTLFEYTLKTSSRARRMWLTIHEDGEVVVTAPEFMSPSFIESVVAKRAGWIIDRLAQFKKRSPRTVIKIKRNSFAVHKARVLMLVKSRIAHFNSFYNFRFNRITIRKQKSRWASCSRQRNLSFNYKIAFLPAHLADYIIVHELCHLAELNHSRTFWAQVARVFPNYRELKSELKRTVVRG